MLTFLSAGILLGLSAGFAPGPLLALLVSETLQHGWRAGIKVALAPLITDLPIITITMFMLAKLAHLQHILGVISIIGACFILSLGIKNIQMKGIEIPSTPVSSRSLQKGILVNFLSPHPYFFWFTVGGPMTRNALALNLTAAIFFIASFYVLLVGSKILVAVLTGKSRTFLQGNVYILIMRLLGILLVVFAVILFGDGLHLLGVF
jgi:threonine/homoserine/homoserine lactone efflux protein